MTSPHKRKLRLVVALCAALVLASALFYTTLSAASKSETPSQVAHVKDASQSYKLTGLVVDGSIHHQGQTVLFSVKDRAGPTQVPVVYSGAVPDPFRDGREVIVSGQMKDGRFVGQPNSLITKCPSKFSPAPPSRPA
jgi:cytochrome c-type biogenesis protein CcmE